MNPALKQVSPGERKVLLDAEELARKTGRWGQWEKLTFPKGTVGKDGWPSEIETCYRNGVFAVLVRHVEGTATVHLAVGSLSGVRPTWHEMQRIKNELTAPEATGVEVYPPQDEVVDGADMFHLWVSAKPLPFGLKSKTP